MNRDQEVGRPDRVGMSARQKLADAIQEYVDSLAEDSSDESGILTGWLLVTEEQNPVTGKSYNKRAVRDLQSITTTAGLVFYLDAHYKARIARRDEG